MGNLEQILEDFFVCTNNGIHNLIDSKMNYPLNVYTEDNNLYLLFALIGQDDPSTVTVLVEGSRLIVDYNPETDKVSETNRKYYQRLICKRSFKFTYIVPAKYDINKSESTLKNGLLTVKIPSNPDNTKRIKVNI